jgi:hypothetical protein
MELGGIFAAASNWLERYGSFSINSAVIIETIQH